MTISKSELKNKVIEQIEKSKDKIIDFAKDIAENAETGYREVQTAEKVNQKIHNSNIINNLSI